MRYIVRKGLESFCMIWGFFLLDYWIFVGCCVVVFVLFFLSVCIGIMIGDWILMLLVFLVLLLLLLVLGYKFRKKVWLMKFRELKYGMIVSNLIINR